MREAADTPHAASNSWPSTKRRRQWRYSPPSRKRRCTTLVAAARGMFTRFGLYSVNLKPRDQVYHTSIPPDSPGAPLRWRFSRLIPHHFKNVGSSNVAKIIKRCLRQVCRKGEKLSSDPKEEGRNRIIGLSSGLMEQISLCGGHN